MANINPQTNLPVNTWGQVKNQWPYVLISSYALIVTFLLFQNPATSRNTDILFVLFLGIMLLLHKMPLPPLVLYLPYLPANGTYLPFRPIFIPASVFRLVVAILFLGVGLPYFGTLNPFYMDIATLVGIFVVLALGLNITVGFVGLLDLGYIAFYAAGAYLWAIFSTRQAQNIFPGLAHVFPVPAAWFFVFMLLALVVGACMGLLLGSPVLRLRGDYLAIVTLGFGEVFRVLATNLDRPINITNGAQGIRDIGRPPLFFEPWVQAIGVNLSRGQLYQLYFYFLVLLVFGFMLMVVYRLSNSRIGRAWTAIREDETAAVAMGVPLVRMKLTAFAVGASFAAVMGTIFAAKQLFINPPTFDLLRSINVLSMVILGGMGSIPGVILGATLVTLLNLQLLPRLARELSVLQIPSQFDPTQYQRMLFGLMLILMTIFRPEGILPEDRRRQELQGNDIDVPEEIAEPPPQVSEPDVGMKS